MAFIFNLVLDIINKSKELLILSEQENWDEFAAVDAERQTLLLSLDLRLLDLSAKDNEKLYHQMTKLIALNKELESICVEQRTNTVIELKQFKKNNNVAKAYSQ